MEQKTRWRIEDTAEFFDDEGAAVARAWELTPAGGKRPNVVSVVVQQYEQGSILIAPPKFSWDEMTNEWREIGHISASAGVAFRDMADAMRDFSAAVTEPRVHVLLGELSEGPVLDAVMKVRATDLEALGIETREDAEEWMSRRLRTEAENRLGALVMLLDYEVEIEVPPPLPVGLDVETDVASGRHIITRQDPAMIVIRGKLKRA